ncbi:MAG: hypothetical protein JW888_00060, partial [Pirellulales bacterium]|nr:hypothetical protein [Pirellulales bacterium]
YLDRRPETLRQRHADLEAPQFTLAELRIRGATRLALGHAESRGRSFPGNVSADGRSVTIAELPMLKSGTFTIHLENDAGHADPDPRPHRMRVVPDAPPNVALLKPPRRSTAAPGERVAVMFRATDDHGLGGARLEMRVQDGSAEPSDAIDAPLVLREWTSPSGQEEMVLGEDVLLDAARLVAGQTLLVRAVATDRRAIDARRWGRKLGPQQAESPWHAIRLVDSDQKIEAELERLDTLRAALYKILLDQIRARVDTGKIAKMKRAEQAGSLAGDVRLAQVDIQKASGRLVASIGRTDRAVQQTIKRVLNTLATGKMVDAVRQAEALLGCCGQSVPEGTPGGLSSSAVKLGETQQSIIETLRGLLDVARRAQAELLAERASRPGGDLPDDARKKLEAAREKLDEFLRQQKKVIEATKNLAKKPVEDFTDEEKELMRQLAVTEDDWARFLEEIHSDLSKLAEQDFANSSMLSEMNEIQTEIKMAAGALTKQTADIAVPLEQLAAEMAEELLTNMEKWLPDEPDRERWSQEESLTDEDKEAPMAELPGELEDLVGELFEEEEDLFDEMEDVSSSAADSLDVGAGWDAKDGPISNMSAKGVTGNTLPNTSEMSGRSGEGRSGKSSGEFVGDEAVGKGGRRTPSRLTPDPYEKGQIKDHSRDPVGGATGGGKESGQGGEGLEGPQRRFPGRRDLKRLAGKQASLRNKAETIDLKFEIMDFHRTDLKKMIEVMAQVERDLKGGRYQNALRQRSVLAEGLGNVKQYLGGQVELRRDTTVNLPAEVQKDILGGMQDPSPAGWESLNRQYYERLSTGDARK